MGDATLRRGDQGAERVRGENLDEFNRLPAGWSMAGFLAAAEAPRTRALTDNGHSRDGPHVLVCRAHTTKPWASSEARQAWTFRQAPEGCACPSTWVRQLNVRCRVATARTSAVKKGGCAASDASLAVGGRASGATEWALLLLSTRGNGGRAVPVTGRQRTDAQLARGRSHSWGTQLVFQMPTSRSGGTRV